MNIIFQITEKDMQKGPWVREEIIRLAERLAATEMLAGTTSYSGKGPEAEEPAGTTEDPTSIPEPVSIEEVRAAIAKVSRKHGAERAKAILRKFGAENLSALDMGLYAAAMKEAEDAL